MVIPGHKLGNSQVSVNRTIGPTLVLYMTTGIGYYIVILQWPVGSRRLHQNTTVICRVTMVRRERGCVLRFVRAMSPKLGQ